MSNLKIVERFLLAYNRGDAQQVIDAFAEDAIYHNMPMPPIHGRDAIAEGVRAFLAKAGQVRWVTHNIAEAANGAVLTERTDAFVLDGRPISIPVMGVFEFKDGRITAWRDYFDLAGYQAQLAG